MCELNIPVNSVVIVPNKKKKSLLKKISQSNLTNIKVMTLTEVRKKYYFDYTDEAVYYLMDKYNYVIDVAKMYLERFYEVGDYDFGSSKIKKIINLKKELTKNKLLKYSPHFVEYLKTRDVIFYECQYIPKLDKKMLDEISKICNTKSINSDNKNYESKIIYEFNTIEEEVICVASKICKLVKEGIMFNQIKLCGVTGEYQEIINRIFNWYNIPINFNDNYLISTSIAYDFLENLDDKGTEVLEYLAEKYSLDNYKNLELYNKIIQILNKYVWAPSYKKVKSFIEEDLKNTVINVVKYHDEVEIIDSLINVSDTNYIFLLGFNQGEIPKTYKDESYFNDILKEKLELETTSELNARILGNWLYEIRNTKNLIITYKLTSSLGVHYLSCLNDNLNFEIKRPSQSFNFSHIHNKLLLGEKIDTFIKYGEKEENLELLYSNYLDINYKTYDNKYTKIDKDKLKSYLKNNLVLSYSSMNTYYQCAFRYYLSNILKLNIFEETFFTILGNLFHYILSLALQKEIDLKREYNNYLSKCQYEFNSREKFFLSILEEELVFIINTIKKQNEVNSLNKTYYEEKIEVSKSREDFQVIFKGFVDKLMTNETENVIAIVDYKTGNPDLNLNNIIYGLDLQLPVYVYLASKRFPNAEIAGFYLQKILNSEIIKDYKHTYETLKEDKLKLQGYSNSNINILDKFDASYNESKVIKGMRITSKGLGTKKILRTEQIKKLEDITENKIDEAIDKIIDTEFDINPKRIGMDNLGCKYCQFKDICFFSEKDIKNLFEYKNMEFLGGDDDDSN